MSDKRTFIDSNIILYLFSNNDKRKELVTSLLAAEYVISTQVVNENVNVCLRKLRIPKEEAYNHGDNLLNTFTIANIYPSTIILAFDLSIRYKLSYWDSLIVAAAIENKCEVLFTEDMHEGLIIDGKLTIVNPFSKM